MSNDNTKVDKFEEQSWYIIVNQETRGPLSLRDLDVLLRTNEINSFTYAWKNTMKEWKLMNDIEQIKQSILESSKEIFEIQKKREGLTEKSTLENQAKEGQTNLAQGQKKEDDEDNTIQNKDEDVMNILQAAVGNLLQKTFQQTEDGKWKMFDEDKNQWTEHDQEPKEQMQIMKNNLLNKLKNELFSDQKNNYKRRGPAKVNEKEKGQEKQLTKQQLAKKERNKKKSKRAAQKKKQKWYQAKVNTFIYISGLPLDITQEQVKEFCAKAGVVRIDLNTGKQKIKLYKDDQGMPKGDAAISYARQQSVEIALQMLNNSEIRSGFKVSVEKACFQQKEDNYVPRESKKQSKVQKLQAKKRQKDLLGWNQNDQDEGQGLRIVILKNVFSPQQAENETLIQEIKNEITRQVNEIGQVQRIRFYETHPDGVTQVKFKKQKQAANCIEILGQKKFKSRQLQCEYWDGETDYKHNAVSLLLQNERLAKFGQQIEENPKT